MGSLRSGGGDDASDPSSSEKTAHLTPQVFIAKKRWNQEPHAPAEM